MQLTSLLERSKKVFAWLSESYPRPCDELWCCLSLLAKAVPMTYGKFLTVKIRTGSTSFYVIVNRIQNMKLIPADNGECSMLQGKVFFGVFFSGRFVVHLCDQKRPFSCLLHVFEKNVAKKTRECVWPQYQSPSATPKRLVGVSEVILTFVLVIFCRFDMAWFRVAA